MTVQVSLVSVAMPCTSDSGLSLDDSPSACDDDDDDNIDSNDAEDAWRGLTALCNGQKLKSQRIWHKIRNPGNRWGNRAAVWQHRLVDFSL